MRMELANAAAATKDKRRILEEFIAATGYHEKSAIRVLNSHPEPKHRQTRQRPSLYDEPARGALIAVGSFRSSLRRLKHTAHSIAGAGTQWTFEARGGDTPQDLVDERRDDRPLAPDAASNASISKMKSIRKM
ncbi:MAG: hypothetical protein E5V78_03540 [Mesorhizobium sp.]|nr:MAG: hypothetical protein E5V78_03540 [Mesorhizobium sp.]